MASITKRERRNKDGTVSTYWRASVLHGKHPTTGKGRFIAKVFTKQRDAAAWAREQETQKDNGQAAVTTKQTLAAYLQDWIGIHGTQVRAVTIYNYRATLTRWVIDPKIGAPLLGAKQLKKLTVDDFDKLYVFMREHGIQPRGCRYLHGILRRAMTDAVKKGMLIRNPTDFATVPKEDHSEGDEESVVEAMTREQADAFLKAARTEERYSAFFHVLLHCALRPCEAQALRWKDVDLDAGTARVTQTLTRIGLDREQHPLGWKLTRPKTKRSRRTVHLPDVTLSELRAWRTLQKRERLEAGADYVEHGFVFTTELGSPLELSNVCKRPLKRVMERAGIGTFGAEVVKPKGRHGPAKRRPFQPAFRIYALRHTAATLALAAGVSLKVVSEWLGHTSIKQTADTYAHVIGDMAEGPKDAMNSMFPAAARS